MLNLGEKNRLKIVRRMKQGFYLVDNNDEFEALLPNKFITDDMKEGDEIEVFLFKDHKERVTATTQNPKIKLNSCALLEVADLSDHGAFLDWGIDKHLFVPFREQQFKMKKGHKYVVYLYLDPYSDRLVASSKVSKFYSNENHNLQEQEEVDLFIFGKSQLGFNAIINDQNIGLLYFDEIFQDIFIGQELKGFVKKVREDGKIDLSLNQVGGKKIDASSMSILNYLEKNNGKMRLTDKSSPDEIYKELKMSKKTFKQALGGLYKKRLVQLHKNYVQLNK